MRSESGQSESVWMRGVEMPPTYPLRDPVYADVVVVGAGIAGITTAYLLGREGLSVVVLDDGAIGGGETSRTTAHLSNAFDDRYYEIERLHGERGAQLTAGSHTAAIERIARIIADEGIDCDFERVDGYLFAPPGDPPDDLERELLAARRAGLADVRMVDRTPFASFETGRALRFPRQAQFHPLRYLAGVAAAFQRQRGRIFTRTHVLKVDGGEDGKSARVETSSGVALNAADVVVATNTPINTPVSMPIRQAAYRTFVVAVPVESGVVRRALYWDTAHPYHYARFATIEGSEVLIVGGEDHKTGQEDDADARFRRLEGWARERFPVTGAAVWRWSGQVMEPVDALGFIGRDPGHKRSNVFIATGDSGNGMTHGTIAGMLLTDMILGRENPWATLYDPSRRTLRAAGSFASENLNMVAQYTGWVTPGEVKSVDEIPPGSGAIMRRGLRKVAVYRDPGGALHECSATCPHLGAIVSWNSQEKTWDCPAHGSRFDATGRVLNGPAVSNLAPEEHEAKSAKPG